MSEPLPPSTPVTAPISLHAPSEALLQQALTLLDGERHPTICYLQRHLLLGYRAALGLRQTIEVLGHADPQGIMNAEPQGDEKP